MDRGSTPLISTINNFMARQTIEDIKSKFEIGDLPTQEDFSDLIDSCYNAISGGYTGHIQFEDTALVTHFITISGGMIADWEQTPQIPPQPPGP